MKRTLPMIAILAVLAALCSAEVDFSIRFFDKRIYFPGQSVPVKITLRNDSPETYRFKLADDKMYSIAFEMRGQTNRALAPSESFIRKQARNQPVFFRELALQPGEEYSFVEDASEYVDISETGMFTLNCLFYPELSRSQTSALSSNKLMVSVRPEAGVSPVQRIISEETKEVLKAERLSPDDVVRWTIGARQKGHWNEFFLYLDLESLLSRDGPRKQAYQRESDEGRTRMLDRYRDDLRREAVDGQIATIPNAYEIIDTRYTPSRGQVRVMERFQYPGFTQKMEYTYYLKRSDDIWYIYDYSVTNKGTE